VSSVNGLLHEGPMLRPAAAAMLQPSMVLAIEAPCYVFVLGGFAPEDVLLVTEEGNEIFTHAPAELPVI